MSEPGLFEDKQKKIGRDAIVSDMRPSFQATSKRKTIRPKIRKTAKKVAVMLLALMLVAGSLFVCGNEPEEVHAADGFTIRVGFYGGPYYEIKSYSSSGLSAIADHTVHLYTGVDAGSFMTASYAWGVPISSLISNAGINQSSIKFLYFGTSDSREESIVTYSASSLMGSRLSYPNMIKAVDLESSSKQQTISSSKLSAEVTSGSKSVPTILALGYTTWSRQEVVKAAQPKEWIEKTETEEYEDIEEYQEEEEYIDENGQTQVRIVTKTRPVTKTREVTVKVPGARTGFKSYSAADLTCPNGYRLTYGQGSILENNVRASSKNITEIDVQLSGSPNIKLTKRLVRGKAGEIGSKYSITVKTSLPDSYSYLSDEVIAKLQAEVLKKLQLTAADEESVKITAVDAAKGKYTAEITGKGETDINYSYSRQDYDGTTSLSDSIRIDSMEEVGESGDDNNDNKVANSEKNKLGLKKDNSEGKQEKTKNEKSERETATAKWMAADEIVSRENVSLQDEKKGNVKGVAAGAGAIFGVGFCGTLLLFRRRI